MEEEKKDVNTVESSATEGVTENVEETTTVESPTTETETPATPEPSIPEEVKYTGDVDEKGVPYKNRFAEYKRKYEDLTRNLPDMIQQAVAKAIPQGPVHQERQPTLDELTRLAYERPELAPGIEAEKAKIQAQETARIVREEISRIETEKQREVQMQESLMYVQKRYPEMFSQNGDWNLDNPLTKEMVALYNSFPEFKNSGWGLAGAADMAKGRLASKVEPKVVQTVKEQQQKIKNLEKRNLPEGAGKAAPQEGKAAILAKLKAAGLAKGDLTDYYKAAGYVPTE